MNADKFNNIITRCIKGRIKMCSETGKEKKQRRSRRHRQETTTFPKGTELEAKSEEIVSLVHSALCVLGAGLHL